MNCLNSLLLEGKLKSYEFKEVGNMPIMSFSIESERYYRSKTEYSYFDCECFRELAIELNEKLKKDDKDRKIRVVGRLKQTTWKDDNGKSQSKIFVVCEHLELKNK